MPSHFLWNCNNYLEIMPSINIRHPIISWDRLNFRASAYSMILLQSPTSMPGSLIHLYNKSIDWMSTFTLPVLLQLQNKVCLQVSVACPQLCHLGLWFFLYVDWLQLVLATLITCLQAHTANIVGTSCNATYTVSHAISSNSWWTNIFMLMKFSQANC